MKYLSVALENSTTGMDVLYTYSCEDDNVNIGDAVDIPFGLGNKKRKGFVFEVNDSTEVPKEIIKSVSGVEPAVLSKEAVHLCCFLKKMYMCRYIDGIKCFIPSGYFKLEDLLYISDENEAINFLENEKSPKRQKELIKLLLEKGAIKKSILKKFFGIDYSVMKAVEKKGLIIVGKIEKKRVPYVNVKPECEGFNGLTPEQEKAFKVIKLSIDKKENRVFLVHGVTGSGKTRLYMESVRACLEKGKTAIVLVPEISLTFQSIERFRGEFGAERIAVLHSKLSEGERFDEWMRIKRGEVDIVLGARSALFAPLKNIGVIVIDEEHESSYKADNSPKYDTRELAEERAKYNNGILIMGSATPSVSSYYRSEIGEITRLSLFKRYNSTPLPDVHIIDMREELKLGNKSIFSIKLYEEMVRCLKEKKQIILFLNRRGYSSFISCRSCGYVMKCEECGVSMTYHKSENAAVCHYCGRKMYVPKICPECGSKYIKDFGVGTEKVEEIVNRLFPSASVARLDLDTVRKKGSAETILADFRNGNTDILIGTQLVAKGLDFSGVDLVGIIAADISLNIPDFRSGENTFQLVTQAAGRAGRGEKQGVVVVQTYSPQNYALKAASEQNYLKFYNQEISIRRQLGYPPFGEIVQIVFHNEKSERALECAVEYKKNLIEYFGNDTKNIVLGPKSAHILKNGGRYRFRVLVIYKDRDIFEFLKLAEELRKKMTSSEFKDTAIGIDINPYSFV